MLSSAAVSGYADLEALLNELSLERFDPISDEIVAWVNSSEEKRGAGLPQITRLIFEKAAGEARSAEAYARLCKKLVEQTSTTIQDERIRDNRGRPFAGGQLFRKYLLNCCKEDFERDFPGKNEHRVSAEIEKELKTKEDSVAPSSDGNLATVNKKWHWLRTVQFIGELFKVRMLTERIIHKTIKKLLGNVEHPNEELIEGLCTLLSTVGLVLDTRKSRAHIDVYFSRMKSLRDSKAISPRMATMLQDTIELRQRKWSPRSQVAALDM